MSSVVLKFSKYPIFYIISSLLFLLSRTRLATTFLRFRQLGLRVAIFVCTGESLAKVLLDYRQSNTFETTCYLCLSASGPGAHALRLSDLVPTTKTSPPIAAKRVGELRWDVLSK